MAEHQSDEPASFLVQADQPLIGVLVPEEGHDAVRYFLSEEAALAARPRHVTEAALALAGAWRDLDWDEVEAALDRIRHESPPSRPLEL